MRVWWCSLCLASGAALAAADDWRSTPLDVYTMPYTDGRARLTVDWGSQGDHFERKPQQVVDEHHQLVAWLKSPAVLSRLKQEQSRLMVEEQATATRDAAAWKDRFETAGQKVTLGVRSTLGLRHIPLPDWMTGIPGDMRPLVHVGIFDASDPDQVCWAIAQRTAKPELHLFAVGWTSMKAFRDLHLQHPTLSATTVVSVTGGPSAEDWIGHYQVTALPAYVHIAGTQLVIEEGGIP
jgi:hypothetical protein